MRRKLTFNKAINEAIFQSMSSDKKVIVMDWVQLIQGVYFILQRTY